ncbi:unnamed protein product [Staurois parvus]|uniref:Uncharacterized protein n=1 Tax=Staurois parvus TaxID=386267 RepID=A0ABN9ADJ3_9NEOB|nr:unnamed protein product [Staurois parvus]
MYIYTDTCTYIHTHTHVHTHTCTHTDTCTYTQTHVQLYTCTCTHTPPPPHKKLQYFVVHSQIRVLHSRGRQRAKHALLPLLSLISAVAQSDGSQCQ